MNTGLHVESDLASRKASMREVLHLAAPIILSMMSMSVLGMVDTLFMRWVGPAAQAAVGIAAPSAFALTAFFLGILSGLTTFVSQYFGAKRHGEIGQMLWHSLYIAIALSILAILIIIPLIRPLLVCMQTNPDILDDTVGYIRVRIASVPWVFVGFALLSYLRGLGNMKTPAIVSIITIAANLPFTYLFTFGYGPIPAYGAVGAAIGTVISQSIETACYALVVFSRKSSAQFHTRTIPKPKLDTFTNFLKISLPVGFAWGIEQFGWLATNLYIASLPKEASAAHAIVFVFMNFCFMPGLAISISTTTLVGQYIGAKNIASAERSARLSTKLAAGIMIFLSIILFVCRYAIGEMFSDDTTVIQIVANLFCFGIVYQIFDAMGVTISGALRGAGDTRFPMFIMFICMWFVMVPLVFILGNFFEMGIYGAWASMAATISLMGICYFVRFQRGKWKTMTLQ